MIVLQIARFTFKEATRKRVVFGALALSLLLLLVYYLGISLTYDDFATQMDHGMSGIKPFLREAAVAMMVAGLYVVSFLSGLLAIFAAVAAISGEIESGTIHSVVPKPIARWQFVLGRWLGLLLMVSCYVVGMSLAILALTQHVWGHSASNLTQGVFFMVLSAAVLMTLTILGSCLLPTVANGIVVLMIYGVGLLGGLIEQLGHTVGNQTMVTLGIVTSLILPSDSLWKMASYSVQPQDIFASMVTMPIFGGIQPTAAMLTYIAIYFVLCLLAAILVFSRRDL